jgi:hypothetical protein
MPIPFPPLRAGSGACDTIEELCGPAGSGAPGASACGFEAAVSKFVPKGASKGRACRIQATVPLGARD